MLTASIAPHHSRLIWVIETGADENPAMNSATAVFYRIAKTAGTHSPMQKKIGARRVRRFPVCLFSTCLAVISALGALGAQAGLVSGAEVSPLVGRGAGASP